VSDVAPIEPVDDPADDAADQWADHRHDDLLEELAERLTVDSRGLLPAIVQDASSSRVLMLAWMDVEALRRTLTTRRGTYWSRSRQIYWVKGETSGNIQHVREVRLDCDRDTVLVRVDQHGPACHTGAETCFDDDVLLAEGTLPTEGTLPADGARPADGTLPAEDIRPAGDVLPAEGTRPAADALPAPGHLPENVTPIATGRAVQEGGADD
jgi:phosphoribosyl-AMP cyclohydrolase